MVLRGIVKPTSMEIEEERKVIQVVCVIQMHMGLFCIAMGILQSFSSALSLRSFPRNLLQEYISQWRGFGSYSDELFLETFFYLLGKDLNQKRGYIPRSLLRGVSCIMQMAQGRREGAEDHPYSAAYYMVHTFNRQVL